MAVDVDFLEARVKQLERKYEAVQVLLSGTVSEAAIQRLLALRQSEIIEIKEQLDTLNTIVNNLINQP